MTYLSIVKIERKKNIFSSHYGDEIFLICKVITRTNSKLIMEETEKENCLMKLRPNFFFSLMTLAITLNKLA